MSRMRLLRISATIFPVAADSRFYSLSDRCSLAATILMIKAMKTKNTLAIISMIGLGITLIYPTYILKSITLSITGVSK